MVLCGHGDPYRKGTEYVVRGFGQSGRDVARLSLDKPVNQSTLLGDWMFGAAVGIVTLLLLWWIKDFYGALFLKVWNALSA